VEIVAMRMAVIMRTRGCAWVACSFLALAGLTGCDTATYPIGNDGTGLPPNSGVERSFSGVTVKTFTASLGLVGTATLQSLNYMDIGLTEVRKDVQTWDISAAAGNRMIDIHLEAVSPKTTLMRVIVDRGDPFFKDGATATEIVLQTADALHERPNLGQIPQTAAEPAPARTRSRATKSAPRGL
jgi:hypothetical protein